MYTFIFHINWILFNCLPYSRLLVVQWDCMVTDPCNNIYQQGQLFHCLPCPAILSKITVK